MKNILFYRDLIEYTGGHQKVADYFQHCQHAENIKPQISFSDRTHWNDVNPWLPEYQTQKVLYEPSRYDYIFVAGMDWNVYLPFQGYKNQPVINLIQHVRHADAALPLRQFLKQPAVRICVSPQVADAITETQEVNGPVFTINNGIELLNNTQDEKKYDVIILGIKNYSLAQELSAALSHMNIRLDVILQPIARQELLHKMMQTKVAVLLPHATEGFYLPALEAMALSDLVVVPDCIGNRGFCTHKLNCLIPEYTLDAMLNSITEALHLCNHTTDLYAMELVNIKKHAQATVAQHSLHRERQEFLSILQQLDTLWATKELYKHE